MRAKLVVFPVKGRSWCFNRSIDPNVTGSNHSASSPSTLRDLWKSLSSSSSSSKPLTANAELIVDFASNKMNKAWIGLEKAPKGSLKNKIYGVGLWLLARVKPSEIFLKSISKDINGVEITYPASLNGRLVRRRLRHIAMSGTIIHKRYMYGSASLLPGSEKLLQLVSDGLQDANKGSEKDRNSQNHIQNVTGLPWVLRPSKELEELIRHANADEENVMRKICRTFQLDPQEVLKYQKL